MAKRKLPLGEFRQNEHLSFAAANLLKDTGRTQAQIASEMGLPLSTLNKFFTGNRQWSSDLIFSFCQAAKISADEIGGIRRTWDPRTDAARVLADFFGEHSEPKQLMRGYVTILPASKLPQKVQSEKHKSVFARMKSGNDEDGMVIAATYEAFGMLRTAQCTDGSSRARERLYMQACNFERLVNRKWPYNTCTEDAVIGALEFLSDKIDDEVIEIRLLADKAMPESLKRRLAPYDSLVSFAETATVEITSDYVAHCSICAADGARHNGFFDSFEQYVLHDTSKEAMRRVISEYRSAVFCRSNVVCQPTSDYNASRDIRG